MRISRKELEERLEEHERAVVYEDPNATPQSFKGCDLTDSDFSGVKARYLDMSNANLTRVDFSGSALMHCKFERSKMAGTNFDSARFDYSHFGAANLKNSKLSNVITCNALVGNTREIKTLHLCTYIVSYTKTHAAAGCAFNTLEWWQNCTLDDMYILDKKIREPEHIYSLIRNILLPSFEYAPGR